MVLVHGIDETGRRVDFRLRVRWVGRKGEEGKERRKGRMLVRSREEMDGLRSRKVVS